MSGYNLNRFIKEFTDRTKENQNIIDHFRDIDKAKGTSKSVLDHKHHEVTQLINSLFGLLIVPYEKFKFTSYDSPNSMSETDLQKTSEYFDIANMILKLEDDNRLYNEYKDYYLVGSFIRHMRNSLAHAGDNGLQFIPIAPEKTIESVIFYDKDKASGDRFCVELTVKEIRKLSSLMAKMYTKLEHTHEMDDIPEYSKRCDEYRNLMANKNGIKWAHSLQEKIEDARRKYL